jgi:hypothetical protein
VDPEALDAVKKAQRNLEATRRRWPAVNHVAAKAENQSRTNHFAPTIAKALGEHR